MLSCIISLNEIEAAVAIMILIIFEKVLMFRYKRAGVFIMINI